MHSEQSNGCARLPVGAEELPNNGENLSVHAGRMLDGFGSRDGREIGPAQLDLNSARLNVILAQTATHHLR